MAVTASFQRYVVDQLVSFGDVIARRMFGGIGLYYDGSFFGLIDDDVVFFRTDDATRAEYVARGMPAFHPVKNKPELSTPSYYQVPFEVLEDAEELAAWAKRALGAARSVPAKKRARTAGKKKRGDAKAARRPARR